MGAVCKLLCTPAGFAGLCGYRIYQLEKDLSCYQSLLKRGQGLVEYALIVWRAYRAGGRYSGVFGNTLINRIQFYYRQNIRRFAQMVFFLMALGYDSEITSLLY